MWRPDHMDLGEAPHVIDAKNVVALGGSSGDGHYGPFPGLSATTDALVSACKGAQAARDKDLGLHLYAGDADELYELEGTTWTQRSRTAAYTTLTGTARWRFTKYGDRFIATNGLDEIQYIDMSTAATQFANLAGGPPTARFITTYGEFVVLGSLGTNGNAIKWSGLGNSEQWMLGVSQSDEQEFADGGAITGFVTTKAALYIFQEKCIRRMIYVGGDLIMQIDKIVEQVGCLEPNSLAAWGQRAFFLAEEGWYSFDGETEPFPIGLDKFDEWFLSDSARDYWFNMTAIIDPRRRVLAVGYASTNSGAGTPDSILLVNYMTGWPSYARVDHEMLVHARSLAVSIDDLLGDLDADYDISFDDPFWAGGAFYFAAFNTAHTLASFAGDNLEATLTLAAAPMLDGERASVEWLKPLTDAANATIAGGSQVKPSDAIAFQSQVSQQASGRCPQRGVNGFYLASKTVVPAAEDWSWARGFEFKAKRAGLR